MHYCADPLFIRRLVTPRTPKTAERTALEGFLYRHYIQGGFRKFRDKFWNTFKKVTDFIDDKSSNKSKFEACSTKIL